mgnify:CR=1 FL=1
MRLVDEPLLLPRRRDELEDAIGRLEHLAGNQAGIPGRKRLRLGRT